MHAFLAEALSHIKQLLAQTEGLREPMAMSLATADKQGRPSVRTVLLKEIDVDGFVFFTNMTSKKGRHLAENPQAALCIYFQDAHQQVQVEGRVEQVSEAQAQAYWETRARASQIGAWASRQSEVLTDRQQLLDAVAHFEAKFAAIDVPRPDFWNGYRIVPEMIEFWQGHPDRLNQRICYALQANAWLKFYRYP